ALLDKDDPTRSDKMREAASRAAREHQAQVEKAVAELKKLQASKGSQEEAERARASTTDPEARVMRMADGGYRPEFNLQLAVAAGSRGIVGVGVTNCGSDMGQITPMLEDVERRADKRPKEWLVDGGYTALTDIQAAGEKGVKVLAPVPQPRADV